jgi:hypothetical protein
MGLVDKIKNIFTEEVEEDDEIKVEQIKKEVRSVPIESPSVEKRKEKIVIPEDEEEDAEEEIQLEEKAKTPVFFTDRDFEDLASPRKRSDKHEQKEKIVEEPKKVETEKVKPYGGSYSSTSIIQKEKISFKPTPIISPVYGVLDKNYHKEDIVDRKDREEYVSVDGLSVDSIRNKAYGTLEDELEDTIFSGPDADNYVDYDDNEDMDLFDELEADDDELENTAELVKNVKEQEKNIKELEEITMDLTKELDNLLMKKESFNKTKEELIKDDKNPSKKAEKGMSESDLFNLIDSMYEEGTEEE